MLEWFLNETCNITRKTTTNTRGILKNSIKKIYTNISCYSYEYKGNYWKTDISQSTGQELKKVMLQPDKVVKRGDLIEICSWCNMWFYEITLNPKPNYLYGWEIDSIELTIKEIWR